MQNSDTFPFPEPIQKLPLADIPLKGCEAHLLQGQEQQLIFMSFAEDVILQPHAHAAQWAVVLSGEIELTIGENTRVYHEGDTYFIPSGTVHSGKIFTGYSDVTLFDQKDRYSKKSI